MGLITGIGTNGRVSKPTATEGIYLLAGHNSSAYRSSDGGATWVGLTFGNMFNSGISTDGRYQILVYRLGYANVSTFSSNYGVTWAALNWNSYGCAVSADGQYMYYGTTGYIYRSVNYGASWTTLELGGGGNFTIDCSYDGSVVLATSHMGNSITWVSLDYGNTWTYAEYFSLINSAISKNTGQYMYGVNDSALIRRSTDYGLSWSNTPYDWQPRKGICVNNTGQYVLTGINSGYIQVSSDYGSSYTSVGDYGSWVSFSCSKSGKYQFAAKFGGYIYKSTDFGATWNPMTSLGTGNWRFLSTNR